MRSNSHCPFKRFSREELDARRVDGGDRPRFLRAGAGLRRRLRSHVRSQTMAFDYVLGSITTLVIMGYLVFALIRPERF